MEEEEEEQEYVKKRRGRGRGQVRPTSYDAILEKMGVTFHDGQMFRTPMQQQQQQQQYHRPRMTEVDRTSYIYNKYFQKAWREEEEERSMGEVPRVLTRREQAEQLVRDIVQMRRIREIKSRKLLFSPVLGDGSGKKMGSMMGMSRGHELNEFLKPHLGGRMPNPAVNPYVYPPKRG